MSVALTPEESRLALHFGLLNCRLHIAQQSLPPFLVELLLKLDKEVRHATFRVKPSVSDAWLHQAFPFLHLSLVGPLRKSDSQESFHQIESLVREAVNGAVPEEYATHQLRRWVESRVELGSLSTEEIVEEMVVVLLSPLSSMLNSLDPLLSRSFSTMICEFFFDLLDVRNVFGININQFQAEIIRSASLQLCCVFSVCCSIDSTIRRMCQPRIVHPS